MKTALPLLTACFLLTVLGCQSPSGGGPSLGEGFNLLTPARDTTLAQGATQNVTVTVNRGPDFKHDVTLETRAAKGITVEPAKVLVKASALPDVQLKITAPKGAALGDYKIYLKGTPDLGQATSTEFTVSVITQ